MNNYDKVADWYDKNHLQLWEKKKPYMQEILNNLKSLSHILDLGCGTGEPIAKFFIENGCYVTGVDSSVRMIEKCRSRFPKTEWILADISSLSLARTFDVIIYWDSFFHLTHEEQRSVFDILAKHMNHNGLLLFNSGRVYGEITSEWAGESFYHASLNKEEYQKLLEYSGFDVLKADDDTEDEMTVWFAKL